MTTEILITTSFEISEPLFMRLAEKRILAAGGAVTEATFGVSPDAFGTYQMKIEVDETSIDAVQDVLVTEFPIEAMMVNGELVALAYEAGTVATKFGDVHIRDRVWHGRIIGVSPSLPDCATLARRLNVPGSMVWQEAKRLAEPRIGMKR